MKIWYAFHFVDDALWLEREETKPVVGCLVRAANSARAAELAEGSQETLPEYMQTFVSGLVEVGDCDAQAPEAFILGPLGDRFGGLKMDEFTTYWRRDAPSEYWVNINKLNQSHSHKDAQFIP